MAAAVVGRRPGIVAALDWEAAAFSSGAAGDTAVLVETTGPGPAAAAAGAERLLARGASVLVSWGTAGALTAAVPGDIVLPRKVRDETGREFDVDADLGDSLARAFGRIAPIHRGAVTSVATPVASVAEKQALARASGAFAVDMESAAIAQVAADAGLPLVVVRVVIDRSDRSIPAAAIAGMDGPRSRPGRVLGGLLKSPMDAGAMIALALAARRARRTLAACAQQLPAALNAVDIP